MELLEPVKISLIGLAAGLVASGAALAPTAASDQMPWASRADGKSVLLEDDGDDTDDDATDGNTGDVNTDDPTGEDGPTNSNDATNSVRTAVSRDEDVSRAGLTRDRTMDGPGGMKRDWSDNRTNDASVGDTRASQQTNDGTRSNYTGVSRDRDRSRGDVTKDSTRDGGDLTRDLTRNSTNDKSRNDTR
jgi:hypothetical protein